MDCFDVPNTQKVDEDGKKTGGKYGCFALSWHRMDPSNTNYVCLEKLRNHAHARAFLGTNKQVYGELMSYFHDVYRPRSLLVLGCVLVRSINELHRLVHIVPEHERHNLHLRLESEDSDVVNDHIIKAILEADGVPNMEARKTKRMLRTIY
jgi:hypothetical protein